MGWFEIRTEVQAGQTCGIYEWRIAGEGVYVGKSKNLVRRRREYPNNVRKLSKGDPYRKGKPDGFRRVHHSLLRASTRGGRVYWTVLEVCSAERLQDAESEWIALRRREYAEGGPPVLND